MATRDYIDSNRLYAITIVTRLGDRCKSIIQDIRGDLASMVQPGQAPAPLALAFAIGTLLSFIPAPILDTVLVGVILTRFKQVNRPALLAARMIWNDLVVVPLYAPGFRLGMSLFDDHAVGGTEVTVQVIAFIFGTVALAAVATVASILLIFGLFILLNSWRQFAGNQPD